MGGEVYIDLYVLINASMDLLCLLITARLLHRRLGAIRALLASLFGGLYAAAALLLGIGGAVGFLFDCLAAVLLVAVALWTRGMRLRGVLGGGLAYALIAMAMGGVMTALYVWLNRLDLPFEALQGDLLSAWVLCFLAPIAGLALSRGGRLLGISQGCESVTVEATLLGRPITLRAMVDSGNLLRDPVSGRGVILADRARLSEVLPSELVARGERWMEWLASNPKRASRIRLIPAHTATGGGLLPAILPDRLIVDDGKERCIADYLIAISELDGAAQGFDAVIPKS